MAGFASFLPRLLAAEQPADDSLLSAEATTCQEGSGGSLCRFVFDVTGSQAAADLTMWLVEKPISIALVLGLAWLLARAARKLTGRIVLGWQRSWLARGLTARGKEEQRLRAEGRARSVQALVASVLTFTIWAVAGLVVLGILGIDLGPILVSAGIIGLALSLGAQSLVRDLVAGMMIVFDDRLAVGDDVDLGEANGTVERITLTSTMVRDDAGTLWHVPNGEIKRVANYSQGWTTVAGDARIPHGADLARAKDALRAAAVEVAGSERFSAAVVEPPGEPVVRSFADDAVLLRVSLRVDHGTAAALRTALNERARALLDEAGIPHGLPVSEVLVRDARG